MNAKIRRKLARSKHRIQERLDKNDVSGCEQPMLAAGNIHYELAERTRAISAGGMGMMQQLVQRLELDAAINQNLRLFKKHLPYHESDHVLSIAYNLLAGGTCLEHLEVLRQDEVFLDALGARRIPDPTTAGDFCRRFDKFAIFTLAETINEVRLKVWRQQPQDFFDEAVIDRHHTRSLPQVGSLGNAVARSTTYNRRFGDSLPDSSESAETDRRPH